MPIAQASRNPKLVPVFQAIGAEDEKNCQPDSPSGLLTFSGLHKSAIWMKQTIPVLKQEDHSLFFRLPRLLQAYDNHHGICLRCYICSALLIMKHILLQVPKVTFLPAKDQR